MVGDYQQQQTPSMAPSAQVSHRILSDASADDAFEKMFIANEQKVDERKGKLDAIGTLLEKAVIVNPYKAPNSQ